LSRFNPTSTGAGIAVHSVAMFASGFSTGKNEGCYAGSLSELYHEHVTDVQKSLTSSGLLCVFSCSQKGIITCVRTHTEHSEAFLQNILTSI